MMNERIQALWKQAGGHYNSGNQHTWPEYTIDDPEKFAELIVEECVKVAHPKLTDVGKRAAGMRLVQQRLKQHFGVEE